MVPQDISPRFDGRFFRYVFNTTAAPDNVYDLLIDPSQNHLWEGDLVDAKSLGDPSAFPGPVWRMRYRHLRKGWRRLFSPINEVEKQLTNAERPSLIEWSEKHQDSEGAWHSSERAFEIEPQVEGSLVSYRLNMIGGKTKFLVDLALRGKDPADREKLNEVMARQADNALKDTRRRLGGLKACLDQMSPNGIARIPPVR